MPAKKTPKAKGKIKATEIVLLAPKYETGPQRAPFAQIGCAAHKHSKRSGGDHPGFSEKHHIFPLSLQARVWPGVNRDEVGTIRDRQIVALCGNGHTDVHAGIDALLADKRMPPGVGLIEKQIAQSGVTRYKKALAEKGGGNGPSGALGDATPIVDLPEALPAPA